MRRIKKHQFEAVSLLTVDKGLLDITVIPAEGQPDWVVPTSLILSVDDYDERIWTYLWRGLEVSVYQLISRQTKPDKIIVLEGNTDVHRIGLQTRGELKRIQVGISDIHDTSMPQEYTIAHYEDSINYDESGDNHTQDNNSDESAPVTYIGEFQGNNTAYIYQTVDIDNVTYLIPDLDELAHRLVDLDS